MSKCTLSDLQHWDDLIVELGKERQLDWYEIAYETCDYHEMLGAMAYHGMPTHYNHWSYGKSFEQQHTHYQLGMTGLPYELIINSDPCIAYLMLENPMYLQILIMAHCVGHSDFFKMNRTFAHTRADTVVPRMRHAKKRINSYIEDPNIGIDRVESLIDACHAISYQVPRYPQEIPDLHEEYELYRKENLQSLKKNKLELKDLPYKAEYDILGFCAEFSPELDEWERDVIQIVRDEAYYFMPQIRTKIMNEGWACLQHYNILHELELPQKYHIPFLKSHNQVVRPHPGRINPYHLGFHLFQKIVERYGYDEALLAREVHNDESFIRQYLTREDCEELNLFSYSPAGGGQYVIDDVSDDEGWEKVKETLIGQVGANSIPVIYVDGVDRSGSLTLHHEFDGRELQLQYARKVMNHIERIWGSEVSLVTMIDDAPYEL
jgi:stage V sporulation protein R